MEARPCDYKHISGLLRRVKHYAVPTVVQRIATHHTIGSLDIDSVRGRDEHHSTVSFVHIVEGKHDAHGVALPLTEA
jgi:hypothetical protein